MDTNARVGTAVAAGYLFGRFKKLRLALMAGALLASDDVRKSAVGLVQHGVGGLTSGGAGRLAGTAGSKLVDAGRGAAVSAAAARIERLSDRLAERTEALGGTPAAADEQVEDDGDEDEAYDEDEGDEDEAYDEDEEPVEDSDEYEDVEEDEEPEDEDDEYADEDVASTSATARRTRARRSRAVAPVGAGSR